MPENLVITPTQPTQPSLIDIMPTGAPAYDALPKCSLGRRACEPTHPTLPPQTTEIIQPTQPTSSLDKVAGGVGPQRRPPNPTPGIELV